jgi:hypothetical protein
LALAQDLVNKPPAVYQAAQDFGLLHGACNDSKSIVSCPAAAAKNRVCLAQATSGRLRFSMLSEVLGFLVGIGRTVWRECINDDHFDSWLRHIGKDTHIRERCHAGTRLVSQALALTDPARLQHALKLIQKSHGTKLGESVTNHCLT